MSSAPHASKRQGWSLAVVLLGSLGLALACRSNEAPDVTAKSAGTAGQGGDLQASAGQASGGNSSTAGSGGSGVAGAGTGGSVAAQSLPVLALGPFSACVIGADRLVTCAGRCGPVGKGGSREMAPAGLHASAVAVGREFGCAILGAAPAGSVVQCWGGGAAAEAPKVTDAVEIVAGDEHACVRSSQGTVICWGDLAHVVPAGVVAKALAASGAMTCAVLADDSVRCWGNRPAEPPADLKALSIAVSSQLTDAKLGPRFGCAVTLTSDIRCWGDDPGNVQAPPAGLKAKAIAVGRSNGCAIGMDDTLSCWGAAPRFGSVLPAGLRASAVALSFRSAAAVTLDGKLVFWGDVSDGRNAL